MDIKEQYRALLRNFLVKEKVKSITAGPNVKEKFFDKLKVKENGTLEVTKGRAVFDNLYFDYTIDYAAVLLCLEKDIFCASRHTEPVGGYIVEFYE